MKQLITFLFLSVMTIKSIAQSDTSSYYSDKKEDVPTFTDRFHAAVSVGAGITSFNSRTTSTFTYIAPSVQYKKKKKFAFTAGLIHYNLTGNPFITKGRNENSFLNRNQSSSGNIMQLGGLYQLNDRVRLYGSVLYKVNPLTNNKAATFNSTSIGLDYKVNPHTTISIQTNIGQGNNLNPYFSNPIGPNSIPYMQQTGFTNHSTALSPH